jgi:FAD/FMN-containing dehydrogenase/Fe-S oxidoreductase
MNKPLDLKELMIDQAQLAKRLRQETSGEVMNDSASRGRYATDASIYQAMPVAVLVPKTAEDIATAIQIAAELGVPVLPRGGGTSQCGQTTGAALVIDNSKYFRNILDLDLDKGSVEVEPGIVLDHLNHSLKQHGLWYPVDVSTGGQATIGGMAGNNSCGSRSIAYGNMVHNVLGINAWLANGQIAEFDQYANSSGIAKQLGDFVKGLANTLQPEIEAHFPKVLRRVAGYNLDIFHPQSELPYTQDGSVNLSHLLVGSEGTLAYFKSLKLKLSPLPKHKVLGIVNFASFYKAMDSAQHIVKLGPTAVELVDRTMIDLARSNPSFTKTIETALIDHTAQTPEAILLVEFSGETHAPLLEKLAALQELIADLGLPGSVVSMSDTSLQKNLWEVRKAGLNIMMSLKGDGKPVSFIEDCAVPLEHLAEYTQSLTEVFAKHGTRGTWYAHASVGTLHVRPILDMRRDGAKKMREIAQEASALIQKFKGAYSGEHGDGLCRGEWVAWQFGSKLTQAFQQIKQHLDPDQLLCPQRIVDAPRMDDRSLMRYSKEYQVIPIQTALDWRAWDVQSNAQTEEVSVPGTGRDPAQGFAKAIDMCNNNGHCRKFDAGAMCPSYRVTRDEQHLTRGRANTLRLALSGQLGRGALTDQVVQDAMDLCVGCKACKRECPTGVDMARMKIEVTHQNNKYHGYRLRDHLIGRLPDYARWASHFSNLLNLRNRYGVLAWLGDQFLGLSQQRKMPHWQTNHFFNRSTLGVSAQEVLAAEKGVVLFVDTFNGYFESNNALSAFRVLTAAGYSVHIASKSDRGHGADKGHLCCGRTYLSTGMVDKASEKASELIKALLPFAEKGLSIVGLEPSCLLTLRDENLVLGLGPQAQIIADKALLFEEFLSQELKANQLNTLRTRLKDTYQPILVHGHCHQKAMGVVPSILEVIRLIPGANPQLIESSCCGMAGSFGYESDHQQISMQMAELDLLPRIRAVPDAIVVADGTSCRHQIMHGSERPSMHVAQLLSDFLKS